MAKKKATGRVKRRERKNVVHGAAHIKSTFNNTIVTITDLQGNTIAWESAGTSGFKGSRKSTPFAAQVAAGIVERHLDVSQAAGVVRLQDLRRPHQSGARLRHHGRRGAERQREVQPSGRDRLVSGRAEHEVPALRPRRGHHLHRE